ncbi:MAG: DUF423 domain-containing protein [Flavobacteriales bacterium]|nr:DUF423 domain-containing protein [Flavobacteriales bacterium]
MKLIALVVGSFLGGLSVVFGAFGAHKLKDILSLEKLQSFETGVRYQMYHAIVLLIIGFMFELKTPLEKYMIWSFMLGTFLFSFSIYFLSMQDVLGIKMRFLGPVTPLGGLLMIVGWGLLCWNCYLKFK